MICFIALIIILKVWVNRWWDKYLIMLFLIPYFPGRNARRSILSQKASENLLKFTFSLNALFVCKFELMLFFISLYEEKIDEIILFMLTTRSHGQKRQSSYSSRISKHQNCFTISRLVDTVCVRADQKTLW